MPRSVTIDGYDFEVEPLESADLTDRESVYVILLEDQGRLVVLDVGTMGQTGDRFASEGRRRCWEDKARDRPVLVGRLSEHVAQDYLHITEQIRRYHDPPCSPG